MSPSARQTHSPVRPFVAVGLAVLWSCLQIVFPAWHLLFHEEAHQRAASLCAETLDIEPFRNPATGRIDLDRLSEALNCGLQDHSHDPEHPFDDSNSVALHHGIVTPAASGFVAQPAHKPVWCEFLPIVTTGRTAPTPLLFLSSRRSQAPPA